MLCNQRHLFDIADGITYLNTAAYSPLLTAAFVAGEEGLKRKYHPWDLDIALPSVEAEVVRKLFAELIGAKVDDVAIVNSASYGIETAARNLHLSRGQKVVVIQDQFPSNIFSWRRLAVESKAKLLFVARPVDGNWTEAVLKTLDQTVGIAALPPCHWSDGSTLDLVAIGARCRELGVPLVVDATQAAGAMSFDVQKIQPDFVACAAYKWLLCPYTIAFLYAAPHQQTGTPLEFHRWNHSDPSPVASKMGYSKDYHVGARRYDMGEVNNLIHLPMAKASLIQLTAWTPDAIQGYLRPITDYVANEAEKRGWQVPPPDHRVGHFIGMTPSSLISGDLVGRLQKDGIHISKRGTGLRISPYLFNEHDDISRLFAALDKAIT